MLAAGNTNLTPWGGPTARAASALHVDVNALFVPLVPTMVGCFLFTLGVAYVLGRRERARVGALDLRELDATPTPLGGAVDTVDPLPPEQIGRASCRERV